MRKRRRQNRRLDIGEYAAAAIFLLIGACAAALLARHDLEEKKVIREHYRQEAIANPAWAKEMLGRRDLKSAAYNGIMEGLKEREKSDEN